MQAINFPLHNSLWSHTKLEVKYSPQWIICSHNTLMSSLFQLHLHSSSHNFSLRFYEEITVISPFFLNTSFLIHIFFAVYEYIRFGAGWWTQSVLEAFRSIIHQGHISRRWKISPNSQRLVSDSALMRWTCSSQWICGRGETFPKFHSAFSHSEEL